MDQLSLPFRIVLVAVLAVGALYLVVLKPSGDPAPGVTPVAARVTTTTAAPSAAAKPSGAAKPSAAPGVKGLTSAVGKARGAATAQAGSDAAKAGAAAKASGETAITPTTASTPGTAVAIAPITSTTRAAAPAAPVAPAQSAAPVTKVRPVEPAADPSGRILAALDRGHTVVLLFAGRTAADDRAVRAAVARIARRGGRVEAHVVPMQRVGDYEAITRGVQVQQSPTLLVIGKDRMARTITGFTTTSEINQLVADVRRG